MNELRPWLPLIAPLVLLELGMIVIALRDLRRRERVKGPRRWMWVLIILFVNLLGPILYLLLGRED